MALFAIKDTVKSYVIIFFFIVLGTVAGDTVEAISNYTSVVLCSIIILIVFKVLYNIVATIKQFIII